MDFRKLAIELAESNFKTRSPYQVDIFTHKGEFSILIYLTYYNNHVTSGELAKEFRVTTGRIATVLKGLEKKGYIVRSTDAEDRRKVTVTITGEGRKLTEKCRNECYDDTEKLLRYLGEEDAKEYVRLRKRLNSIDEKL